jgi:hypothetical protein
MKKRKEPAGRRPGGCFTAYDESSLGVKGKRVAFGA